MPLSKRPSARRKQLSNLRVNNPAEPGNRRAVKHGGSARPEPQRQAAIEAQLAAALPVRDASGGPPGHDAVAVRLLAITLCRLESCAAYVTTHGQFDRSGRVRPAAELEDKLTGRASNLADKLGLTPTSRAKLGLDLARTQLDLAQLMSDAPDKPTRTPPDVIDAKVVDDD